MSALPSDAAERSEYPMADGLLYYFPSALAAVARVSKVGNAQHNGDEPMHWARNKSTDHANKIIRHLMDAGTMDSDGTRHSAKVAWRALALLEDELIAAGATPGRNAVGSPDSTARKLYDETSAIAAAQDGAQDIDWNACFPTRAQLDAGIPAEFAYLASFGPNNYAEPREDAAPLFDSFTDSRDYGITRWPVACSLHLYETTATSQHPMAAEALRYADELPEDRL